MLTGKYRPGQAGPAGARLSDRDQIATDAQFALIAALQDYADAHGVSMVDVAIGALLADQTVSSVIAGATRPEQVAANAGAAHFTPDAPARAELRELLATHPG